MKFIQCGPTGSDATAPYDVILDRPYTVKDLVCEILTKHEWGEIRLPGYTFKYRGSSCDAMPPDLLQMQIREVKASGGYGDMNYYIKTSVKTTVLPIIDPSTLSKEQRERIKTEYNKCVPKSKDDKKCIMSFIFRGLFIWLFGEEFFD